MRLHSFWLFLFAVVQSHSPLVQAQVDPACPAAVVIPTPEQIPQLMRTAVDRGYLWRLEKDGKTSWLYGTIHIAQMTWMFPGPQVTRAIQSSKATAFELNLADPGLLQRLGIALNNAQTKERETTSLDPALVERLNLLTKRLCAPEAALAPLSLSMKLLTLGMFDARFLGLEASFGIDGFLAGYAQGFKLPVHELETVELQAKTLTGAVHADQISEQLALLESGKSRRLIDKLATAWEQSDYVTLQSYATWCECVVPGLVTDRNQGLATAIASLHDQKGPIFAAIGALHMLPGTGVQALLQKLGFSVEQIVLRPT